MPQLREAASSARQESKHDFLKIPRRINRICAASLGLAENLSGPKSVSAGMTTAAPCQHLRASKKPHDKQNSYSYALDMMQLGPTHPPAHAVQSTAVCPRLRLSQRMLTSMRLTMLAVTGADKQLYDDSEQAQSRSV